MCSKKKCCSEKGVILSSKYNKYSYCVNQNDKESCEYNPTGDSRCEYITNPLRDSVFNWYNGKKLYFRNNNNNINDYNSNCLIIPDNPAGNNPEYLEFTVQKTPDNKFITIDNAKINTDQSLITPTPPAGGSVSETVFLIDYNSTCPISVSDYRN